ncbi:SRPBCC domain-containing protein [Bacillus sp. V3-13]|uniref:SRPBCC domain-containing protein n=1 Tax=Bacillus sp. V3-13 TaxID=2053728 RepID=UPI001C60F16F|nr:SRPBCC domain-containing protein [Bacillus sp. V3-13]
MAKSIITSEPGQLDIIIQRELSAPCELVFIMYTDSTVIPKWWGPRCFTTVVECMDVRKGGLWRYIQTDQEGGVHAFNGVYHEIDAPRRIVRTFEYEGAPGDVLLETVTLEQLPDGGTMLIAQSVFQTSEARDAMLRAGAESGGDEGMERLEELLAQIQSS